MRGAQGGDARVDGLAERGLHARGGPVRRHGAPVVEGATEHDRGGCQRHERHQRAQRVARDHAAEEPPEERQPRDARADGQEAEQHGARDARAHAARKCPEPTVEVHGRASPKIHRDDAGGAVRR